tara:strand:+ start:315 stop:941 length:627 start_codon:yes stop_codon:yes gene_type:complete
MENYFQYEHMNIKSESFSLLPDFISSLKDNKINFVYLGQREYYSTWLLQKQLHQLRKENKIPDIVLLLEHDNVYTFGKNADKDYLLDTHLDAEVFQTDRGGQVTYHGPGQLVGYPIMNLHNYKKSITWFMHSLEQVIINTLDFFNIKAIRQQGLPGVWVDDEKICAMGVRIAQWVTMHGFALNVNPNMKYFEGMIPCGILDFTFLFQL